MRRTVGGLELYTETLMMTMMMMVKKRFGCIINDQETNPFDMGITRRKYTIFTVACLCVLLAAAAGIYSVVRNN